jgi:hypothetical protein
MVYAGHKPSGRVVAEISQREFLHHRKQVGPHFLRYGYRHLNYHQRARKIDKNGNHSQGKHRQHKPADIIFQVVKHFDSRSAFYNRVHKNTPVDPAKARMADLQQTYTVEEYCLWFKIISNIKWFVAVVLSDPGTSQDIASNHTTTIKIPTKCTAAEDKKSRDPNTNFINFTNLSM